MRGTFCFHNSSGYFIVIIAVSAFLALLAAPAFGVETKTAYTRDGINFISKERMEENIRYEYARPGDYREVQVPQDTIVVGESTVPDNLTQKGKIGADGEEKNASVENEPTDDAPDQSLSKGQYPYAPFSIALLITGGLVFAAATVFSGRKRS
jgi:hypothetical protein